MTGLRVTTFNALHGVSLVDGRVDAHVFSRAVSSLDADVLALQEVDAYQDRSGRRDQTADVAATWGALDWRFAPTVVGTPGLRRTWRPAGVDELPEGTTAYGVALLSRLPVDAWAALPLREAGLRFPLLVPTPDGTRPALVPDEPRTALAAVVRTSAGPVSVITTHLSFVPGWNAWQLRRIVTWARRRLPPPRVLVGDLNLPGPLPALASGWRRLSTRPTYPAANPRLGFDAALGDEPDGWRVVRSTVTRLPVSDHAALSVHLAADDDEG